MTLRPTDGNEVPDADIQALEEHKPIETTEPGSEPSTQTPAPETKVESGNEPKVPYHEDPAVQLYIERQVQKRVGEGNQAWQDRVAKLEDRLTKPKVQDTSIGGWKPGSDAERTAAKAIILQAKREMAQELSELDRGEREKVAGEDREFGNFLGELRTTGTLKSDEEEMEFARLIVEYKLEDKQAAVNLWTRLQEGIAKAREEGNAEGTEEQKRNAQAAKVGSSRKGSEPGKGERGYNERRAEEPNFDAIYNKEMEKLGL